MRRVTLIEGDGIGSEISASVIQILKVAKAEIEWDIQKVENGVLNEAVIKSIEKNRLLLKGPLMTPIGKGHRSLNVQLRKHFDLYANIRPVKNIGEIPSRFSDVDCVIFRENTEDLYAGIEEMIDEDTAHSIKVITRSASMRIAQAAFAFALEHNRSKVTIVTKANIMKLSDGLFLECCREVAKDYPTLEVTEVLVDNMCMQMVINPNQFDVILTENLYGDILSDLAAGLIGGLGLVPSANIGEDCALFEAVHGSAPDIAGKGIANPSALLLSACLLLDHISQKDVASKIRLALESLYAHPENFTFDLKGKLDTHGFTQKMIEIIQS